MRRPIKIVRRGASIADPEGSGLEQPDSNQVATARYATALANRLSVESYTRSDQVGLLATVVADKAPADHLHSMDEVDGLLEELSGLQPAGDYAEAGHGHDIADVSGLAGVIAELESSIGGLSQAQVLTRCLGS